ncbi:Caspase [Harpegnathos saltator]|uniref:Caspase n=1 Tax=Harpegnathos saltator TaxID=610380 RepID=E2BNY1_HARSA|nr:Caspase [Harpegnathos saltator]
MQADHECTPKPKQRSVPLSDQPQRSVPDGWPFSRAKYTYESQKPVEISLNPHAEEYNMNHKRRGVALVLNHIHFESMSTRKGSERDAENLRASLSNLGFDVQIYTDPTIKTISTALHEIFFPTRNFDQIHLTLIRT